MVFVKTKVNGRTVSKVIKFSYKQTRISGHLKLYRVSVSVRWTFLTHVFVYILFVNTVTRTIIRHLKNISKKKQANKQKNFFPSFWPVRTTEIGH